MNRYSYLLWFLLSCCSWKLHAQQHVATISNEKRNQAEMAIVNNQIQIASALYQSHQLEALRLNDLNNFYLTAIEQNNLPLSLKICREIARRGVGSHYFSKSIFTPLKKYPAFLTIIDNAETQRINIRKNTLRLSTTVDSLYRIDQIIAARRTASFQGKEIPQSILDSFDTNTAFLIRLIKQEGFPTEGNVAPELFQDSIYYFKPNYLLIIVHCLQVSKNDALKSECRQLVNNAVKNGKISCTDFLYIQEFGTQLSPTSLGEEYFAYDPMTKKIWQNKHLTPEMLQSINKTRKSYGIPTIQDDIFKIKFNQAKAVYRFHTALTNKLLNEMNEERLEKFMDLYQELK